MSNEPLPADSSVEEISDYELCSVSAIAEEVLFSLTPEPENRKRMVVEALQKPFYLSKDESMACKEKVRADIEKLDALEERRPGDKVLIANLRNTLEKVLVIETLTSEDCDVRESVAHTARRFKLDWPDPEC